MEIDIGHHRSSKSHCHKCGRRCRKSQTINYSKQARPFPTEYPWNPTDTSANANDYQIDENSILIDQLIEVQQLSTSYHPYEDDVHRLKRVQQMIYLRENINNSNYRELHFPSEYIIQKQLEEKSPSLDRNRIRVDHYYRPLKLQYQTISTSIPNLPIQSFTYTKDCSLAENHSDLPTDSLIVITPYQKHQHHNYSTNAIPAIVDIDPFTFETAVIVDVKKCSLISRHRSSMQIDWNQIRPTRASSLSKNNQSEFFSVFIDDQQRKTISLPCSQQESLITNHFSCDSDDLSANKNSSLININNSSDQYASILQKLKRTLNLLQQQFLNRLVPFQYLSDQFDRSLTESMTPDSLGKTASVVRSQSAIDVDSLNKMSDRFKLRNPAKNINCNQQISDDDDETERCSSSQSRRSHESVSLMSPSFMFILQILLVLCLANRILIDHIFGIVSVDSLVSDSSQAVSPISFASNEKAQEEAMSQNKDNHDPFFLSLLNLI